jgi:bis(5'-nucleosyl)-tetraphosphatase (symmetrical)
MATYAIGDLHGCHATLEALLERIGFDAGSDRAWLVGDLVNRGPRSLAVLRWAHQMGDSLVAVLGNHDLHLLARAEGLRPEKRRDTLDEVLAAPDRDELLAWLRRRPLFHRQGPWVMVHAGLLPAWTLADAAELAQELEEALAGDGLRPLLAQAQEDKPLPAWRDDLDAGERLRLALYAFTNLRTLLPDGRPDPEFSGPPHQAPGGHRPWFDLPAARPAEAELLCGHWAALGLHRRPGLTALDSGAAWGGPLSALRLEDGALYQQPNLDGTPRH